MKIKSNKQRKIEIRARRRKHAKKVHNGFLGLNADRLHPRRGIEADRDKLSHTGTYDLLPLFYTNKHYTCRDCGVKEVWSAAHQKWWYEVIKADINSKAVRCYSCRAKLRKEKEQQKKHMIEMAKRKPHPNEAFFKKVY